MSENQNGFLNSFLAEGEEKSGNGFADLSFQPYSSFTADMQDLLLPSVGTVLPDIPDADAVSAFSLSELSGVKHYFNQPG